ncbi:AAA family ATPase [Sphingomonas melonis]|uniref:AAA family ATPase n=1 Tax=Sphingomonas melonis TaxID=152682 RepID=UPI002029CD2D|nr:AAA family ATPase [Sphingomonas melonis]
MTEVRRQREDWQKEATRALATGRTGEALDAYGAHGMVHAADTREAARPGWWTGGIASAAPIPISRASS